VITTMADELTELGYVERHPDPEDRRAKLIVPTDRGLDQMRRSDAIARNIERRLARQFGAEELEQVKKTLAELAGTESVDGPPAGDEPS
jgi:DNA-binding MarR family transcriptional regulator